MMIPGGFSLQAVVTVGGLVAVVGLLSLLFCHYLGGWTWIKAWILSSREEKMVLTKQGTRHHFNPNGYMVSTVHTTPDTQHKLKTEIILEEKKTQKT